MVSNLITPILYVSCRKDVKAKRTAIQLKRLGMMESAERLQYARRKAGFADATAAARAFGWNFNTYRSHENGTRGLRRNSAARYAKAFRVSPAWLLVGEGIAPDVATTSKRSQLSIDPEDLRKVIALVLRSQGTADQLAADLADTVVESFSAPPLASVGGDLLRSVEVRLELQARQLAQLGSR